VGFGKGEGERRREAGGGRGFPRVVGQFGWVGRAGRRVREGGPGLDN
jgi:hypothetical protein